MESLTALAKAEHILGKHYMATICLLEKAALDKIQALLTNHSEKDNYTFNKILFLYRGLGILRLQNNSQTSLETHLDNVETLREGYYLT